MNADRVLKSKRAFRRQLAARPIAEKLRMLDTLRERAVTIRRASSSARKPAASAHSAEK
jgi:hypothetical protein